MESGMVINTADSYCQFVKTYFNSELSEFVLENKYSYSPYWEVVFRHKYIKIIIGGDIGFSIEILIDESKYSLWQYDRSVIDKMKTTNENILFQLKVLKKFLNEVGY